MAVSPPTAETRIWDATLSVDLLALCATSDTTRCSSHFDRSYAVAGAHLLSALLLSLP